MTWVLWRDLVLGQLSQYYVKGQVCRPRAAAVVMLYQYYRDRRLSHLSTPDPNVNQLGPIFCIRLVMQDLNQQLLVFPTFQVFGKPKPCVQWSNVGVSPVTTAHHRSSYQPSPEFFISYTGLWIFLWSSSEIIIGASTSRNQPEIKEIRLGHCKTSRKST